MLQLMHLRAPESHGHLLLCPHDVPAPQAVGQCTSQSLWDRGEAKGGRPVVDSKHWGVQCEIARGQAPSLF